MENMIQQVVNVLREEEAAASYEVSIAELEQTVRNRIQPLARSRNVNLATLIQTAAALPNRTANLVTLVLVNLIENALQATPSGKNVALTISAVDQRVVFEVRDEGGGFPADAPLFMPCRSSKEGGTGIGLALCKQLANHLGAELELTASTSAGCVFALRLPMPMRKSKPAAAPARLG
jgi:signal transduction histidine kinase